jgi:hypothetical protein
MMSLTTLVRVQRPTCVPDSSLRRGYLPPPRTVRPVRQPARIADRRPEGRWRPRGKAAPKNDPNSRHGCNAATPSDIILEFTFSRLGAVTHPSWTPRPLSPLQLQSRTAMRSTSHKANYQCAAGVTVASGRPPCPCRNLYRPRTTIGRQRWSPMRQIHSRRRRRSRLGRRGCGSTA